MGTEVSIFAALVAGLLSFFSPCVFPLLPAYVANITGSMGSTQELRRSVVFQRSLGFITGFTIVFILLGILATGIGEFLLTNKLMLARIGGLLIIVFGLQMLGLLQFRFLMMEKRIQSVSGKVTNSFRSVLVGMTFAFGWSPCVGLTLGSIMTLASMQNNVGQGAMLLLIYSLGMGVPFLIVSLLLTNSKAFMTKINRILPVLNRINGGILVALGLLLFTGGLAKISSWLSYFGWQF
ncbi:cytochrome c biogenesis CcdA family protein [Aureibacillus halotolerans]|uniref:Cytochrome c-type biogenesis protein n=1 Tax=Aureibacillus halotolerans TaxID=1508390 RepID=A0A4R6TSZ4_9BACI|nr:cytochrome c biogenesis protein CcdA [Aureibacillus halotolerans]TDQ36770.1 cytochrome c-type biogenesis protein [Aureibacillus halotolerans]